jgi:hypothetical protein
VSDVALGAATARGGLDRRLLLVALTLGSTAVAVAATFERRAWPIRAPDHTLVGVVFGIVVPVFAYACMAHATAGGLVARLGTVARFGTDRRRAALGYLGVWVAIVALASAWFAALGLVVARGLGDPLLLGDCVVSMRIGLLGGAAYTALLAVGSILPGPRWWQLALLFGDWLLGTTTTAASAVWPRGHVRTLLGAEPTLGLSQPAASFALWGMVIFGFALTLARTRR